MKKLFGVQAEVNITCDDDFVKSISKGITKGVVALEDVVKELKPDFLDALRKLIKEK